MKLAYLPTYDYITILHKHQFDSFDITSYNISFQPLNDNVTVRGEAKERVPCLIEAVTPGPIKRNKQDALTFCNGTEVV